jgi:predicted acetyltransferase
MTESGIDKKEKPYVMGRIVDVQKAFDNITLAREIDLVIEVLDPLLEWNNNRFSFAYKNDGLSVLTTSNPPDFEIPISTLTQLLWGYYTPWQAMQHGLIKTFNREKIEDLDILFPKTTPYIYEDY